MKNCIKTFLKNSLRKCLKMLKTIPQHFDALRRYYYRVKKKLMNVQ